MAEEETEMLAEEQEEVSVLDPVVVELKAAKDQLLRLAAEFDNFKKRSQKEKDEICVNARAKLLGSFLPVLDNFSRAQDAQDGEDYRKGIDMIYMQLAAVFDAEGAKPFGQNGEAFDPNRHNAVMHVEDETLGANVIAEVFSQGWQAGEKVIREAVVSVAN
jgi:molecular chaperone GrpE